MKRGVMKELTESTNTREAPATMPGTDSGSTTCRSVRQNPAPRVREASSSCGRMPEMTPRMLSTANGSSTCTIAITTPVSVPRNPWVPPTRNSAPGICIIRPDGPMSTTQPKVRTTTLVISGRITTMRRKERTFEPARAMMYDSGTAMTRVITVWITPRRSDRSAAWR